ncbi:hypothetical protein [Pannonibacter carbonis]|uniref:hypothetical protein n=1 Tax=Pannonibacter carbonis TaxID=2067569 RepID=UPI0013007CE4|nr:hypothetical protein [Pannonibacter carbonis]
MPTSLEITQKKFHSRVRTLDAGFDRHVYSSKLTYRLDKLALQEGYISSLWQVWCKFCRDLLVQSAQGAITKAGNLTTSPYVGRQEMEIAYIAQRLSKGEQIKKIHSLSGSHLEHTWGDVVKMHLVTSSIGCSNDKVILSALSVCQRIKDLQICRNSSAHINATTLQAIRGTRVRYLDSKFHHPTDMMYWTDPNTRDFLWKSWIDEMEIFSMISIA